MWDDKTLKVQVVGHKGALVVIPHGVVDMLTAPVLEDALRRAVRVPQAPVVVDMGDVDFLDCRGVGVLAAARAELSGADRPLVVKGAQGPVRKVLQLCETIGSPPAGPASS